MNRMNRAFSALWNRRRLRTKVDLRMSEWERAGSPMPAPHAIKMSVLNRYSNVDFPWIETGTYLGETTKSLAKVAPLVISLEPERTLYRSALDRLGTIGNIELLNLTSEEGLSLAISELSGFPGVNFWLDGHYSQGETYRGSADTPILSELDAISEAFQIGSISRAVIFVDDVRLFASERRENPEESERPGYPSLDDLVGWAQRRGHKWIIEHDIFVTWID